MKKLTDKGVLDWLLKEDTKKLYDTEITGLTTLQHSATAEISTETLSLIEYYR